MVKEVLTTNSVNKNTTEKFGEVYLALRDKENRMYTDAEVRRLPDIENGHLHAAEWKIRKASCRRLIHHLQKQKRSLKILEVGCGNGWLSARLSAIGQAAVTGIDLNVLELEQAKRVFADKTNLEFQRGSLEVIAGREEYDTIVFAASIQYFSSFPDTMREAMNRLKPGGEIHIVDTKFYSALEVIAARKRSVDYFESQGSEEMSRYYFHHEISDLISFDHAILFNPAELRNRLFNKSPFYWICLYKK